MFDSKELKKEFKILDKKINGNELVYLDNAATSQIPNRVLQNINDYYCNFNSNVHRGIHTLSEEATDLFENARKNVAKFINAKHSEEIIFTSGSTHSVNLIANSLCKKYLKKDDIVLVSISEHHSNMVPWQVYAKEMGARVEPILIDNQGLLDLNDFKNKLTDKVKIIAVSHASNVLGSITDIKQISKLAHANNSIVCVDGAQSAPHLKVNVQSLDCDFYSFSGHKMCAPSGIGVLYGKKSLLQDLEPFMYGGGMIDEVKIDSSTYAESPQKFEAGTPNIMGAIALSTAIDYLNEIGMDNIRNHEIILLDYAMQKLSDIAGLKILGPQNSKDRTGLISFTINNIHAHDVSAVLNTFGVAVRSGHHCTMPLHNHLNIAASTRASFYFYNTKEDIDKLVEAIKHSIKILG